MWPGVRPRPRRIATCSLPWNFVKVNPAISRHVSAATTRRSEEPSASTSQSYAADAEGCNHPKVGCPRYLTVLNLLCQGTRHGFERDRRGGPPQALRGRRGAGGDRPGGGGGHGLRPPRTQRSGQDDRGTGARDRPPTRRGTGGGARVRRRAPTGSGPAPDRPGRAVRGRRPEPDREGEPPDGGAAGAARPEPDPPARRRAARAIRPHVRRGPAPAHLLGRHAAAARHRGLVDAASARALPGRAHDRPRHHQPQRALGGDARAREGRHLGAAHDAISGGGRPAGRTDRCRGRRSRDRERHAGGPEVATREHGGRDGRSWERPCAGRRPRALGASERPRRAGRGAHPHHVRAGGRRPDRSPAHPGRPGHGARRPHRARAKPGRRLPGAHRPPRRGQAGGQATGARHVERGRSMSSTAVSVPATDDRDRRIPFGAARDIYAITQRNLIAYRRVPQLLVFSTIQPVIFVLMFRYVFGGAITLRGLPYPYVDVLMPGIFPQTVAFGAIAAAIGLSTDVKSGLMERFHSLPMARSAVLAGRTMADLIRNVFVVVLMMVVGFLVGWRIHTEVFGLLP